jgi:Cu/Ag efflux protein CusF
MKINQTILTIALTLTLNTTTTLAAPIQDKMEGHKHSDTAKGMKMDMEKSFDAVGVLNSVDVENHKVNITHEPIKAIGWPTMTMDFNVSKKVDLSAFKAGDNIDFKVGKGPNGIFMVKSLKQKK